MKSSAARLLALALCASPAAARQAATDGGSLPGACSPGWQQTFGPAPGTGHDVYALAGFDDGLGGGPALYAGGTFVTAGGVAANRIAKWDGSSWFQLGNGVGVPSSLLHAVYALQVFDDGSGGGPALYAAGDFPTAGGVAVNHIAKWDGTSWSALGSGVNKYVSALTVFDDGLGGGPALYAGGTFTSAGTVSAKYIAKWDGASWSQPGSGMSFPVQSLTVFDDGSGSAPVLCAGGRFSMAGGVTVNSVAQWNGTSWAALGTGLNSAVSALTVYDDGSGGGPALYAGGGFTAAGAVPVSGVAKWDGTSWSALGTGPGLFATALTVYDDGGGPTLIAGGIFNIAQWDGSSWSALGGGIGHEVRALMTFDDGSGAGPSLYAGGLFKSAGGVAALHIAKWRGTRWSALGSGLSDDVRALQPFDDGQGGGIALYVGGDFASAGGAPADSIAKWDGTSWSRVGNAGSGGSGMDGRVRALAVFDDGSGAGPALYAGGGFKTAGGGSANRIARWDGSTWTPLGSGMDSDVYALEVFDDGGGAGPALYAAGIFAFAGSSFSLFVAKWDGASWSPVQGGNGLNGFVADLAVFDDGSGGGPALYAVGGFTIADGTPANRVAKWDGSSWSPVGTGFGGGFGLDLEVFDDGNGAGPALYAAGNIWLTGAPYVLRWDGATWSPLGAGVLNNYATALAGFDDGNGAALYVGGYFKAAGGAQAHHLAKWDGTSWSPLGSASGGTGMDAPVFALTVFDDGNGVGPALYAGGEFTSSAAGDSFLAKWGCASPPPWSTFCTAKTALVCGAANIAASGSASASATSGFIIEAQPVRGCRAGLLLYSNQPRQPGASFGGPGNGLLCLSNSGPRRAGPVESGGTSAQVCDGILSIDMNRFHTLNWTAVGCNPPAGQSNPAGFLSSIGTTVSAQMWGRDSIHTGQVLSDGIAWTILP